MAKKQKVVFFEDEKSAGLGTCHSTEKNQHSRQPSFDENSSSLFVSPANEPANGEMRANQLYKNQKLAEMEAISESAQSDEM